MPPPFRHAISHVGWPADDVDIDADADSAAEGQILIRQLHDKGYAASAGAFSWLLAKDTLKMLIQDAAAMLSWLMPLMTYASDAAS